MRVGIPPGVFVSLVFLVAKGIDMRRNRTGEIGLLALFAYVFVMTCAGGAIEGTWHPIENTIEGWVGWDVNGDGDVAGEAPQPPTVE